MLRLTPFTLFHENASASTAQLFSKHEIVLPSRGLWLITGPSGAGKSTLLSLIKGLIPHFIPARFNGEVYYKNQLIDSAAVYKKKNEIVYLFQNPFQQIVYQNAHLELSFTAESQGVHLEGFLNNQKKIDTIFDLTEILNKKTSELSLGQAQKLLLASLLASGPEVLLLDEPTAFLDSHARIQFYALLSELRKDYLILMVDHHIEEVRKHCNGFLQVIETGEVFLTDELPLKNQISLCRKGSISQNLPKCKVKMQDVSYSYDKKTFVLNKINFEVQSPDIIALTGVNGAGKSTFLKVLSGYLKPTSGKVFCADNIGFVMQNPEDNFIFDTAFEEIQGVDPVLINKFFKDKNLNISPFTLSEGEKRRLSLLIHLKNNKKIILYDEPTFGLDDRNKYLVAESLIEFKKHNILQIVVSHDDYFISQVADHTYHLKNGQLLKV